MRRFVHLVLLLLAAILTPVVSYAQGFITAGSPPWVYADNYGRFAIQGQNANTYSFTPSSICQITQLDFSNKPTFFAFSQTVGAAPVLIQDINSANSEVVTPGTLPTQTQSTCAVALSPSNSHTTFTLQSGTGGLQEAINAVGGSTQPIPTAIYLTPSWYKLIQSIASLNSTLAGSVTPQSVIANASCTAQAYVVDVTTSPATYYTCNGSHLVASGATAGFPNLRVTSYTGISAPTALSTSAASAGLITSATTGGTIAAGTYRLAVTYVDASGGETLISTDSASTATITTTGSTSTISVTSPAAATGAVGYRLYMSAASGAAGSEILYSPSCSTVSSQPLQSVLVPATVCPIGATATISAVITGTADVPAIANAYPRAGGTSLSFPPFAAAGTVASAATATLGIVNFPAGYLNTLGRSLEVCGNGYATTNGTAGTITLATKLFSVPGVTSITPWSAVSGSIAASAIQVPIDFCVTYTTAATGSSGTLEAHGVVHYGLAGTAVDTPAMDAVFTVSSAVDLTKQDQLAITITPTTAGLTAAQLRQLNIYPSN